MAAFTLLRSEYEEDRLPQMCMSCGRPSTILKEEVFSWTPAWTLLLIPLGVFPYLVFYFLYNKQRKIRVPLCGRHRNLWLKRYSFIWGTLLILLAVAVTALVLRKDSMLSVFLGAALGLLIWPIVALVVYGGTLRVIKLPPDSTTFAPVSPKFIAEVKHRREAPLGTLKR